MTFTRSPMTKQFVLFCVTSLRQIIANPFAEGLFGCGSTVVLQ